MRLAKNFFMPNQGKNARPAGRRPEKKSGRSQNGNMGKDLAAGQARTRSNQRRARNLSEPVSYAPYASYASWRGLDWSALRFHFAAGLFAVLWALLWGRAFYVQIVQGPELERMAGRQHSYTELVEARRGNIYDRNGQTLARSVECRSVYANPQAVSDVDGTARTLSALLRVNPESLKTQLAKDRSFVWLIRKIDDATALAIQEAKLPGIGLSREYERVYPYKHLAGQLLGFVGLDNVGLEGLERSFDAHMAGRSQETVVQRDGSGRTYYNGDDINTRGQDLHLTLDVQIQFIAEDVIAEAVQNSKAEWGGVLVADARSGDVLAWAQYPFFNPNNYRQSSPAEYRNRMAADALEPGSTLKPFLMAAALEEKIITEKDVFFCENGIWQTHRTTIRDDGRSFGDLSADKILPYSSNIGIAKVALEVGVPTYYSYLTRLGFGQRTGIGVGESKGIVRQPSAWSEVDLMSAAFGQSVSVTAVQMTQAYATLANGGLFRPLRLVKDEPGHFADGAEQRIFSEKVTASIMGMLVDVVDGDGTGSRARISGLRVAGKTGTAQKAARDQRGGYGEERLASFGGIVPATDPRYIIYVMLDEPSTTQYGGVLAAPVFQKVASRAMAYGGYLPDVVFARADSPQAAPRPAQNARQGQLAASASPNATGAIGTSGTVVQPGIMPDVRGKSLRRAMEMLAQAGALPQVRGNGLIVLRQEPAPGKACVQDEQALPCVLWMSEEKTVAQADPAAHSAAPTERSRP